MNTFGLVGAIFTAVGIPTFGLGIIFAINFEELANSPNTSGDPILLPILFIALGGISLILGLILLAKHFKSKNHKKELVKGNHYIWAEVVGILDDYYIRLNGRPGRRAMARYIEPGTNREFVFTSDCKTYFSFNADIGSKVKVYYNPKVGFDDYYVELP